MNQDLKNRLALPVTVVVGAALALGAAAFAVERLSYGWTLFVGTPFFLGFVTVALYRFWKPQELIACLSAATLSGLLLAAALLILAMEGLVCIIVAIPLIFPITLLGASLAYVLFHYRALLRAGPMVILAVAMTYAAVALESRLKRVGPTYVVADAVEIAAPPDMVWRSVLDLRDLPPSGDLLFSLGLACPQRTELKGEGVGAERICTLSTGVLPELITCWEPGRRLGWVTLSTPPPMKEMNPFRETDPPHLHGFYESLGGEFAIEPQGPFGSVLVRRSWYRHGLYPSVYWRLWSDLGMRSAHRRVLRSVKQAAESNQH